MQNRGNPIEFVVICQRLGVARVVRGRVGQRPTGG